MSLTNLLTGWTVPEKVQETHIRKYSTTGDILSFKRCRRQYGFFGVRGFSSATATQRYFGNLVHDVLDQINRNYRLNPVLPNHVEVTELTEKAHERLIRSGVRPYNAKQQKELATKLIYRFVVLIGHQFFPYVRKTEYRLERALKTHTNLDYILDGVVDVLSGAVSHALDLPFSTEPDDVEIWDYKSGKMPDKNSREMRDYQYQMRVYAELYRQQTGEYPARCALVFVGELGDDIRWNDQRPYLGDYPRLIYTIHPNPNHIQAAMQDFHETVEAIEAERAKPYGDQWQPPEHKVDKDTCTACELRFRCDGFSDSQRQRAEAL